MKKFMTAGIAAVAVAALVIGGAFAFGSGNGDKDTQVPSDRKVVEAPIDGIDVHVLESFPPQYVLNIQAGLPSGCAEQHEHEVERDGTTIKVSVLNTMPAADDVACTMIYGMYELNLHLGSDFESGETYTVLVNGEEFSFTAQ